MGKTLNDVFAADTEDIFLNSEVAEANKEAPSGHNSFKSHSKDKQNGKKPSWPWLVLAIFAVTLLWNFVQRSRIEPDQSIIARVVDTLTAQPIIPYGSVEPAGTLPAQTANVK